MRKIKSADGKANLPYPPPGIGLRGSIFHMEMHTHVFDNSNLPEEISAIATWRAAIYSFGHGRKHMLAILLTIWRPGLSLSLSTYCTYQSMLL